MKIALPCSALLLTIAYTFGSYAQPAPAPAPPPAPAPAPPSEVPPANTPTPAPLAPFPPAAPTAASEDDAQKARNAKQFEASKKRVQEAVDELLDVPEVPAAFALGLSADVVARPTSLREVTGALKSVLGPDGKLIPGAALEVAPFYRWMSRDATAQQWKDDIYRPLLGGVRLSLATASDPRAADPDNAATLLALGARLGYDGTDARYHADAVEALKSEIAKCAPPKDENPFEGVGEGEVVIVTTDACKKDGTYSKKEKEITEALSGLRVELAANVIAADRKVDDADTNYRGWQGWLAAEWRFSGGTGLGAGLDYRLEELPGPNPHAFRAGGRFNHDSAHFTFSLGAAYARRTAAETMQMMDPMDELADANWLDVGGSLAGKVGSIGALVLGAQWMKNLEQDKSDLIILVSVTTSSGDPVVEKYFKY